MFALSIVSGGGHPLSQASSSAKPEIPRAFFNWQVGSAKYQQSSGILLRGTGKYSKSPNQIDGEEASVDIPANVGFFWRGFKALETL